MQYSWLVYLALTVIATLDQTDEKDRRHRKTFRLQFWIVILTFILALAAVVQTGIIKLPILLDFGGK